MGKILFDLSFITDSVNTGVSKYACRILEYIIKSGRQKKYVLLLNYKSSDIIRDMFPQFAYHIMGPKWLSGMKRMNSYCNMLCFKYSVWKINPTLIFCPYGGVFNCLNTGRKKIVTLHDMQVRIDKCQHSEKEIKIFTFAENHHVDNSNYIFTISDFSRQQILQFYPSCESKLINMSNLVSMPNIDGVKPMKPGYQYILYVGRLCEMKNVMTLVRAFEKIKQKYNNLKVVLLSNTDTYWYSTIVPYLKNNGFEDKVIFIKSCSEEDLFRWYIGAKLFVFPSIREGFGFPPIEAGMMKVPVVTSKADSLEEVTLGLLNYYEPATDADELSKSIMKVIDNPQKEDTLNYIRNEFLSHYSIDIVAKNICDFLERVNDAGAL